MRELPRGTVTFLFTDVEGSTRLLREVGAEQYAHIRAEHDRLLRSAFAAHDGSRIAAAAHGGQIVVSAATRELVRDELPAQMLLRDLGEHRLRDLGRPERLFQVLVDDLPDKFPPLRTLESRPTNLPVQATPSIGRRRELRELADLLRQPGPRLVTLTGTGGTGKTRLTVQAAADALDEFRDGVFFAPRRADESAARARHDRTDSRGSARARRERSSNA